MSLAKSRRVLPVPTSSSSPPYSSWDIECRCNLKPAAAAPFPSPSVRMNPVIGGREQERRGLEEEETCFDKSYMCVKLKGGKTSCQQSEGYRLTEGSCGCWRLAPLRGYAIQWRRWGSWETLWKVTQESNQGPSRDFKPTEVEQRRAWRLHLATPPAGAVIRSLTGSYTAFALATLLSPDLPLHLLLAANTVAVWQTVQAWQVALLVVPCWNVSC